MEKFHANALGRRRRERRKQNVSMVVHAPPKMWTEADIRDGIQRKDSFVASLVRVT